MKKHETIRYRFIMEAIRTVCCVIVVLFIAFAVAYAFLGGF